MMKKSKSRDYPLPSSDSLLSRKDYKQMKRQARWQHNIEAAKQGTLANERIGRVKEVTGAVSQAIGTAAQAKLAFGKRGANK